MTNDEDSWPTTNRSNRALSSREGLQRRSRSRAHAQRSRAHGGTFVRHPASVVIVPIPEPGHVILIRQFRYPIQRSLWELPAGSVGQGETPEAAAKRECHEEIRLVADTIVRLGGLHPTPGYAMRKMIFFRASV